MTIGGQPGRWIDPMPRALAAFVPSRFVSQDMGMMLADLNEEDLTLLRELMQAGKVTPVIDRRYTSSEVPAAIRYLEEGHARGKVVITLEQRAGAAPPPRRSGGSRSRLERR